MSSAAIASCTLTGQCSKYRKDHLHQLGPPTQKGVPAPRLLNSWWACVVQFFGCTVTGGRLCCLQLNPFPSRTGTHWRLVCVPLSFRPCRLRQIRGLRFILPGRWESLPGSCRATTPTTFALAPGGLFISGIWQCSSRFLVSRLFDGLFQGALTVSQSASPGPRSAVSKR